MALASLAPYRTWNSTGSLQHEFYPSDVTDLALRTAGEISWGYVRMISWKLRRAWRDGTRAFLMTPYEFIARLASLVPHPREHQLT